MAVPSPELMRALLDTRQIHEGMRDLRRGYRWNWRRVGGCRWVVERVPVRLPTFDWDQVLRPGKPISTVRMPYRPRG